jgi:predicted unusual protein kinase regulating ubiquinone biosynthesis (AarF/ABC1/UbiB family)
MTLVGKAYPMADTTPRVNRIAQTVRFFRVARLLLWTIWVIYRERRRVMLAYERGDRDVRPNVAVLIRVLTAFRRTAIELGGLLIKLGQYLSSRADLLPQEALAVISSLQDEVPAAPFEHVAAVVEAELGKPVGDVFSQLDRVATAAASLGQVHRGVLAQTGSTVAVKVQRPNVDQLVQSDLSTLRFVIWVINRFVDTSAYVDLLAFYREFKRTTDEELDYRLEAANAKRFRDMFKDDPTIFIPLIYNDYVTKRLLVLEWVDGIKINDYTALEAASISRLEVATRTVRAYFHQFFEEGFFHADPHPGNLFVQKGTPENSPIIAFVDFGMVGALTASMQKALRDVFLAFLLRDSRGLVDALRRLGFIGEGANLAAIEQAMAIMLERYGALTLGAQRDLDLRATGRDVARLLYGQPFQLPAEFAYTGLAIGKLLGLSTGLAPEFNLVEVALPYATKFLGQGGESPGRSIESIVNQLVETGRILVKLPADLERVITKLETGQIEVRLAANQPSPRSRRRGMSSGVATPGFAWMIMFVAALAAGTVLLSAHVAAAGWFCLALAVVTILGLFGKR